MDGWSIEACDNDDCEEGSHLYPPLGEKVAVSYTDLFRQVASDRQHLISAGSVGRVMDFAGDTVLVDFGDNRTVWVVVDDLRPALTTV